jgi:ethanolamine ammonia-lyase small subunit
MEDFFETLAKVKMNAVFANCSEDKEIYPLTTHEIADAQRTDATYKHLFKHNAVEHNMCLQRRSASYPYHHYLQHPEHTSRRDDESCDVLERYMYHYLNNNKVLQDLLRLSS